MSVAGGQSKQKSDLVSFQEEGIFGSGSKNAKSKLLGENLEGILGSIGTGSEGSDAFLQELMNPTFGARNASEEALLASIGTQTQGASALRGLGPATQGGLAQNLAPELIGLRQKRLSNLGQRAQFEQGNRQQSIQGLLELIGLASPQTIAGQKSRGDSFNFSAAMQGEGK